MPGKSQLHLVGRDAGAVIGHAHAAPAPALDGDRDVARAGIQRVLDQLFDHGGRPLDHFAGGDLRGDGLGQDTNRHKQGLGKYLGQRRRRA